MGVDLPDTDRDDPTYSALMEFRVLGSLEVVGESGPVALGGPQQRRVLAALISDPGHVLTYDRLGDVLWPDGDGPVNPRRSAITYVSRLRAAIGDGVVQTTDAGYVLNASLLNVDAVRFTALVDHAGTVPADRALEVLDQALALWRGPVFGDLNGEWWARPYAKKLEELRLTALASRIDAMTSGGWNGRSVAEVTSLLDAHPLREQFVEKAMRGLHSIGQTADALRIFHRYRSELAEQTGLDPSAALCDLESSMATGAALEPSSIDLARPLRGYVLRDPLGEGSFGAVYRATQPGVERDVAVKVIRPELADDRSFVRRFEAEAQLVARLEHPHIVPLYDFWRQPGGAFLVFRLMRGGSAEELIEREGALSIERAGEVLAQIGGALSAAHAANIVHRDVKPANILFDDVGLAYLADFGIAAAFGDDARTPQRWSAGSALYASPEQLRDGVDDARADQYALAVTIWELLTGRAPFGGRDASAVIDMKLREPLGPVDAVRGDVPAQLSAVLVRAGSLHPQDRYPSVADFVGAWQRAFASAIAGDTGPRVAGFDAAPRSVAATMAGPARPVNNPYKGLRPFGEGDVDDFRGRDALVERLVVAVEAAPFTAVVGPSGSGKSSLVLAGLLPRLRVQQCLLIVMTPGESPFASLSAALGQVATGDQIGLLSTDALRRPRGVRDVFESIARDGELVVVIDQFEELWTLTGEEERRRFIAALVDPVSAGFAKVVATIRADFFDRPLADGLLGSLVSMGTFGVTPMSTSELHDAITAPAEHLGVRFEPALVSRLVAETVDQPGSLPLLQFTLAELFERRDGAVITLDSYDALGGLAGSLSRQADDIYLGCDAADRTATRRLFSRLVTPGDGNEDTRRRAVVSDLAGVPARVVAAYVDRRLLTSDRDRLTREPTVEVAHEVLIRSWPRLQGWLAEDRSWLRELRALSGATAVWTVGARDDGDLYRGARLAVVSELAVAHPDALTESEQQFLDRSRDLAAAEEREARRLLQVEVRQNRRLRRSLMGIVVVLAVALAAGGIAVVQRRAAVQQQAVAIRQSEIADQQRSNAVDAQGKAQQSETEARDAERASKLRTLAGQSLAVRSSQRDLAALLAVESWQRSPDATSKSALFGTFTFDPGFIGYLRFDGAGGVHGTAIPGTKNMLVTTFPRNGGGVGPAEVIDAVSGATVLALDPMMEGPTRELEFSVSSTGQFAAERALAPSGVGSVAAVFDLTTGKIVSQKIALPDLRESAAINATGTRLAVGSDELGGVTVYDTVSGRVVASLVGLPDAPPVNDDGYTSAASVAYGPDGRLYVGSTGEHLRVLDPTTFAVTADITVPTYSTTGLMRFGEDGVTLIGRSVHADHGDGVGSLIRIDLATGTVAWRVMGAEYASGECESFAFSVASNQLWCGDFFGRVRERSVRSGARTGRVLQNQKGWVSDLDLIDVPGGALLVGVSNNDGVISRWMVDGGGPIQRLVARGRLIVGAFPDGKTLLVGTKNGNDPPLNLNYTLWDTDTDTEVPGMPTMLFANVMGDAIEGLFPDFKIGSYDLQTKHVAEIPISLPPIPEAVTSSADGTMLALGFDDGSADEYDSRTGAHLLHLQIPLRADGSQGDISALAISADHHRVYASGGGLTVFDGSTGRVLAQNPDGAIANVGVSPLGLVVATSVDGTIGVYDGETLVRLSSLPGARGFIQSILFSADGTTMIGAGNDGSVSVYDLPSGTRIGDAIDMDRGDRSPTALRADGTMVAIETASDDGVELWDLDPSHLVAAACTIAGRNLTREEWATYIGDLGDYAPTCSDYSIPT